MTHLPFFFLFFFVYSKGYSCAHKKYESERNKRDKSKRFCARDARDREMITDKRRVIGNAISDKPINL